MEIKTLILVGVVITFIVANVLGLGLGFFIAKRKKKVKED